MVLEQRWTTVDAAQFASEAELVGPVEHFDVPEQSPGVTVLRPGKGTPAEVVSLLQSARAEDPDEPLWSGVADIRAEEGDVRVQFGPRYEPHLQPIEGSDVRVSCHRYHDPERGGQPRSSAR
jgi:peptide/nickel transport system ATP-binding protein